VDTGIQPKGDAGPGGGILPQVGAVDEPTIQSETDRGTRGARAGASVYKLGPTQIRETARGARGQE